MSEISSSRPAGTRSDSSSTPSPAAQQARVVRRYLSAVEAGKRGKGPKRTSESVANRITKIDELLVSADPLTRVHLTQERIELHAEHVRLSNGNHGEMAQLERDFVRVARRYGDRNGLTYAAWRQVGVDSKVLDRAGIRRAEKKPPPAAVRAAAERTAAEEKGQVTVAGEEAGDEQRPVPPPEPPPAAVAPPPPVTATDPSGQAPPVAEPQPAAADPWSEPAIGDEGSPPAAGAGFVPPDRSPSSPFSDDEADPRA